MQKKLIIFLAAFSLLLAAMYYIPQNYSQPVTIACYQGSALNSTITEQVAATHPNAELRIQAIPQEQYTEWLAEQFVSGTEPDIFIIPAEDLAQYTKLGGLTNLSTFTEASDNTATYSLLIKNTKGEEVLWGVSSRAKYPKLSYEILQIINNS